jgi:glycosyltransferase involved in cell wall biosynthesis
MDVSIIICTRNRAEDLQETLRSVARLRNPHNRQLELLVVDNGSTDDTPSVLAEAAHSMPHLRALHEPVPGHSRSLNRALRQSVGQAILMTDDDVRVPETWLEEMASPLLSNEADAIAGGVRLAEHLVRPWQQHPWVSGLLATTDRLDPSAPEDMVGANMALHRRVLDVVTGFDEHLGPGALGLGADTLLAYRVRAAGFRLQGRFDTVVVHHPHTGRLQHDSLTAAAEAAGRFRGYAAYHWEHRSVPAPGVRRARRAWLLNRWRRSHPIEAAWTEGIHPEELTHIIYLNEYVQFLREMGTPRRYSRLGSDRTVQTQHEKAAAAL